MNESPLRICLVAPHPPPFSGGIERWTLMLTRHVAERMDTDFDLVDLSVRWRASYDLAVWKRAIGGSLQLARDCMRLIRCLRRNPHVVHLTTPGGLATFRDNVMSRIAVGMGVPVVYHLHFGQVPQVIVRNSFEARNLKSALRRVFAVMPIDMATEAALREWSPEARITRVPNCVDLEGLPQQTEADLSRPYVMFLGNVLATKGIAELLKAWTELQPDGWRLKIVGECAEEYKKELTARYPCASVELLGDRSHQEAMQLLARASVFVLPSYTEGFPLAVLEAMALGKPIIGSRVGAIPEMLDRNCGILISPRNSQEVRDSLDSLIGNPGLRNDLAASARARARESYALEAVFQQYRQVWSEASRWKREQRAGLFEPGSRGSQIQDRG